jgi:predicted NBD/HSP70 family sugar kinase
VNTPSGRERRIGAAFLRRSDFTTFTDNEKLMLNLVCQGPLSRADMARHTDLTMQSVVRLVDGLIARGVLKSGEKVIKGPGQPSRMIHLVSDAAFSVGVSIMSDAVSTVLMDLSGRIRASSIDAMDVSKREDVVAHIKKALKKLSDKAKIDRNRIFGLGVATTGYFVGSAELNPPVAMEDWALIDLEENLAEAFDLPVWIENDGSAATVGEGLFGAGQRYKSFAYIYIATGLGGGLVINGKLMRGFRGNAGELTGVLPLDQRASRPTLSFLLSLLQERDVAVKSVAELIAKFDPSWPGVDVWLKRSAPACTAILSAIAAIIDPQAIIIGGRAPRALAQMVAERATYFQSALRGRERPFPVVLASEAKGDAAALGAASIPLKEHFFG